jgi:hypothetical protein
MAVAITTSREEQQLQSYLGALLTTGSNDEVLSSLLNLKTESPYRVRAKVVYAPSSPIDVFRQLESDNEITALCSSADSFAYSEIVGRVSPTRVQVPFFVASFGENEGISERVQAVISVCKSDQWTVLLRLIKRQYPGLVPILLSQAELVTGAKNLRQVSGHQVRVKTFSAKKRLGKGSEKAKKSVREWTDEDLDEALRGIQEQRQALTSLEVALFPKIGGHAHVVPTTTCKIRSSGEIEVTGDLRLAFEAVAKEVARVGERKLQDFAGRGLRDAGYKPRPLAINFSQPIFENLETVRGFVQLLAKYPRSMHAIEHGNPYAHVKITDLYDYSAFEVWAIPPARVALLPGLKASEAAFERLVHHIFDGFKEGQVAEYERGERAAAAKA